MSYFKWTKELETGSQVIDYQHKRLVGLINDLHEIQEKEDFKEELIEAVIDELKHYASFHFSTEEKLFEKIEHENIEEHKLKHRSFEKKLDSLLNERDKYDELDKELFMFLKKWLENHIMIEDKKMIDTHVTGVGLI